MKSFLKIIAFSMAVLSFSADKYNEKNRLTVLFFDDYLIESQIGLRRKWFQAKSLPEYKIPFKDVSLSPDGGDVIFFPGAVLRDGKKWRMWASVILEMSPTNPQDKLLGWYLYRSDDGVNWEPDRDGNGNYQVNSGRAGVQGGAVFLDERETDPSRRYKCFTLQELPEFQAAYRMSVSSDGRNWIPAEDGIWTQHTTEMIDHGPNFVFNPYTQKYQYSGRPNFIDRRIALYQTADFRVFDPPAIIVHPDPADSPTIEFYSMPQHYYEGIFLGFLHRLHLSEKDLTDGRVDAELTYSVGGLAFNRTNRQPFISFDDDMTTYACYPGSMVIDDAGDILVYSFASHVEHCDLYKGSPSGLSVAKLRRDGFCAMESVSAKGYMTLRPFLSQGGTIRINVRTAATGTVRAELLRVTGRNTAGSQAFPGFELENSIPVTGNGYEIELKWKDKNNIDSLKGEKFCLRLELTKAEVYAVRMDALFHNGYFPKETLNGTNISK